jgi:hypothetical protein
VDARFRNALFKEVFSGLTRCREMNGSKPAREHSIHLLRERMSQIAGTEARLDMRHGYLQIKRAE